MTEIVALDLDYDLVNHLAVRESINRLVEKKLDSVLIEDEDCRLVFEWQMEHIREHGHPATGTVLEDQFDEFKRARKDFSLEALEDPETSIDDLVERLQIRYVRNTGRQVLKRLARKVKTEPLEAAQEIASEGRRLVELTTNRDETFGTGDHERAMQEYYERLAHGRGPTFGFKELDNAFDGLIALSFIVAAPKTYKSWISSGNCVLENIKEGNFPYVYSLELPAVETDWRLKCLAANVPFWKFMKRNLGKEDIDLLAAAAEILDEQGTYKISKPEPGKRDPHYLMENALNAGADLVVIDQLQYVETENGRTLGAKNDPGDYWDVCGILRDYSDQVPILAVHQFNRSVMGADEMPEMQQIKGSAALEETGSLILGMWANKEMKASNIVQMGTLASRNFTQPTWEISVELSRGCEFEITEEL